MKKRMLVISLDFTVAMDIIPGWGYDKEDWIKFVKTRLTENSAYDPEVTITHIKTYEEAFGLKATSSYLNKSLRTEDEARKESK